MADDDLIIRDKRGRFLPGTKSPAPITHENAREMQRLGVLAKRRVAADAANRAVEDDALLERYGAMAYIADITRTQMQIATTPEAGKAAVQAANWIVENTGHSERAAATDAPPVSSRLEEALSSLIDAMRHNVEAAGGGE